MTLKLRKGNRPMKYAVHISYVGTAGYIRSVVRTAIVA